MSKEFYLRSNNVKRKIGWLEANKKKVIIIVNKQTNIHIEILNYLANENIILWHIGKNLLVH